MNCPLIIKYACIILFFTIGISCEKENDKPQEDGIKIENLKTRLRIIEPYYVAAYDVENVWQANPENIIINYSMRNDVIVNYPPYDSFNGSTFFGYTDENGETLLCKVSNFPDSAKKWNGEFVHEIPRAVTVTEINVLLSGIVRIETDDKGEKYGTMELTSLIPSDPESNKPVLQPGTYRQAYPIVDNLEKVKIDFIDQKKVKFTVPGDPESPRTYNYEIRNDEHIIILDEIDNPGETTHFFRVINDSEFEVDYFYATTAEYPVFVITSFEREK